MHSKNRACGNLEVQKLHYDPDQRSQRHLPISSTCLDRAERVHVYDRWGGWGSDGQPGTYQGGHAPRFRIVLHRFPFFGLDFWVFWSNAHSHPDLVCDRNGDLSSVQLGIGCFLQSSEYLQ